MPHVSLLSKYKNLYDVRWIWTEQRNCNFKDFRAFEKKNQNITISYDQVRQYARNAEHITRFDVAITLAKLGFSKDPFTAYGEYLDYNAKCYVSRKKKTPIELIEYVKKVGGVVVVAHPKSIRMEREKEKIFSGN